MSVSPASSRAGWHTSPSSGKGRRPASARRSTAPSTPTLTVTLSIPLADEDQLTPPARRLLEAARELLERGEGAVVGPAPQPASPQPSEDKEELASPSALPAPRRSSSPPEPTAQPRKRPGLHILAASRSVLLDGKPLPLTRLEFDLLLHFVQNPRRVFTRLQLLTAVWGYEHTGVRTVDVHIRRLRVKVGERIPLITTVYGVGYRLADDVPITIDHNA
ncbi:MAG TPA: winged helix-turn-helix domain-containing protein [Micromonospora sp.]